MLAAHYDTKISPVGFIGATDSAVPCAMMLHLARLLDSLLPAPDLVPELSLTFIFFDGEEAFKSWSSTDSLYGSRHLAQLWTADYVYSPEGTGAICQTNTVTHLDRIDTFLLLDLLGAAEPSFKRYTEFNTTLYDFAESVERAVQAVVGGRAVFSGADSGWMVQDDQVRNIYNILFYPNLTIKSFYVSTSSGSFLQAGSEADSSHDQPAFPQCVAHLGRQLPGAGLPDHRVSQQDSPSFCIWISQFINHKTTNKYN